MSQNRNYLFDVPASSALYDAEFTRNPAPPSTGHPVRIYITHRENGTYEDKNAELIFVGNAKEKRKVHGKEVRFGFLRILNGSASWSAARRDIAFEFQTIPLFFR
jgi:hypothetical protein